MLLHYNTIPEGILKGIYNEIDKDFKVESRLSELTQMEKILEGSGWNSNTSGGKGAPKKYDAFAELNINELSPDLAAKVMKALF